MNHMNYMKYNYLLFLHKHYLLKQSHRDKICMNHMNYMKRNY